jgi:hypothetical protein
MSAMEGEMVKAYHIKNWDDRENADTRKYVDLLWFRTKVKLLGEGLGHTLAAPNGRGPHLYGMFKLIEQIAAGGRQEQRGWLFRNGSPMTAARIANLLRLPVDDCQEALTFFSTPPLDWLELADYPGESPDTLPANDHNCDPTGRSPGESPDNLPTPGRPSGEMRNPTDRTTTVVQRPTLKKEIKKGKASPEEAKQQSRQWSAAKARIADLEAVEEDERTPAQEAELKKMRALVRELQKKQAAGNFTPVEEKND